jgi:hypothetical protein
VQYNERSEEQNERVLLFSHTFDMTANLSLPLFVYVEVKRSLWVTKPCLILEGFNVGSSFCSSSILDEYFSKMIRQTARSLSHTDPNPLPIPLFCIYNPSFSLGKYKQLKSE